MSYLSNFPDSTGTDNRAYDTGHPTAFLPPKPHFKDRPQQTPANYHR